MTWRRRSTLLIASGLAVTLGLALPAAAAARGSPSRPAVAPSPSRLVRIAAAEATPRPPPDPARPDPTRSAVPPKVDEAGLAAAEQVVETLHRALLELMQAKTAPGFQGRYDRMLELGDLVYDFPFMARASIGRHWRGLDDTERRRWIDLSRRLSAASYADNFDAWAGERFEVFGRRPGPRGSAQIEARLVQPDDPAVRFDYRLRERDDGWRIVDVQLDGTVSELALRRADYTSTIDRSGFERLMADLEDKIERMAAER